MNIPAQLLDAVREGRAVLFLGAGASRGAKDEKGNDIPAGAGLAELIVKRFLGNDYAGSDFRTAYDLAGSTRDILSVQKYIFEILSPFQPSDFHQIIPTLPWAGLLTTNYDLIVERAYAKAKQPLQKLVPNVRDDDGAVERMDYRSVLKVSKKDFVIALSTLRTSLEANPSNRELHFDIARALLDSEPDADQKIGDEIAYHLRRAFSPGDKNYSAQFLYARQLCISGKYEDAKPLFAVLADARTPYADKIRIQEVLRDTNGHPRRLNGTIATVRPTFAFVESESPKMSVYVPLGELEETDRELFEVGFPVSFELAFNLRGPVAMNIRVIQ
jgi:hypothetical protein